MLWKGAALHACAAARADRAARRVRSTRQQNFHRLSAPGVQVREAVRGTQLQGEAAAIAHAQSATHNTPILRNTWLPKLDIS